MSSPTPDVLDLGYLAGDEVSAVLLVELSTRSVVHANAVAQQLAPELELPAGLDEWSDRAELRDPDGGLLSESDHPLSRISRAEQVPGQAVSARRGSDMGEQRQPLWVIAIPLVDAPGLHDFGLVVMLPMRFREAAEAATGSGLASWGLDLHSRAALATGLSFTLADATAEDLPLIWVNPAFTTTTGYELEEVSGRNCRFLQGPGTDPQAVAEIRDALVAGEAVTRTLLNYRRDGTPYWNQLNVSPVRGPRGQLTHFVGIQTDVTDRVEADRARDAALAAERHARAAAEAAESRLRLMTDAATALADTSDLDDADRRLLDLLVPQVGDFALLLGDGTDTAAVRQVAHADAEALAGLRSWGEDLAATLASRGHGLADLVGPTGSRLLRRHVPSADAPFVLGAGAAETDDPRPRLDAGSAVVAALPGRRETSAVLILGRGPDRADFSAADANTVSDLGRRVGLLIENTRLFDLQRTNSEILQRSLLPDLPPITGVRAAARYHAGAVGAQVGGDFWDLTTLRGDTVALAMGDVIGHDMLAAAAMGQVKGLLRACVHDEDTTPRRVLERVDRLLAELGITTLASLVQVFLARADDGWQLTWSSGGHPPPAVRYPDGAVALLSDETSQGPTDFSGNDPLLGFSRPRRREWTTTVPPGTLLLGYTDGLVERRSEPIDAGLARLLDELAEAPAEPATLIDHLVERLTLGSDHDDDIALVALHLE